MIRFLAVLSVLVALATTSPTARPDEGMWTYDNLPLKTLKEKYGFEPSEAWLKKVRTSSVRVSTGGSGSFVSAHGLIMTNHHVALELVNKLSTTNSDFVKTGFLAKTGAEELKCPDANVRVLMEIVDVTAKVEEATAGKEAAAAAKARADVIRNITKEVAAEKKLEVEVTTLHSGGQYVAHCYKVWNDVRLVFVPEMAIAYYGGDWDNFCYPRYCLDAAFLRAYENDKPADTSANHLTWDPAGPKENDLVFVSGHPGSTGRQMSLAKMAFERDVYNPSIIRMLKGTEASIVAWAGTDPERKLATLDELFGVRNSLKAYEGHQVGALDPALFARKKAEEDKLREACKDDAEVMKAFADLDEVMAIRKENLPVMIMGRFAQGLMMPGNVDNERESHNVASLFAYARESFGANDEVLTTFVGAESDQKAAVALLETPEKKTALLTHLRARLGPAQMKMAPTNAREAAANAIIAKARFKVHGTSIYPDATFTLRLSFGEVKGYTLNTTLVPWRTTFGGLFGKASEFDNKAPFEVPASWTAAREKLDMNTPFDFVSTCDITGGNSGSPVVSRTGAVVGLIFDGNIQSLPNHYVYDEVVARSVSVDTSAITAALTHVYNAEALAQELLAK
jgi:hypothetical protein